MSFSLNATSERGLHGDEFGAGPTTLSTGVSFEVLSKCFVSNNMVELCDGSIGGTYNNPSGGPDSESCVLLSAMWCFSRMKAASLLHE